LKMLEFVGEPRCEPCVCRKSDSAILVPENYNSSQDAEKRRESDASSETAKSEDFENEMKALEESGEDTDELRRQYLLRAFLADRERLLGQARAPRLAFLKAG
jgi:hypothetical protein